MYNVSSKNLMSIIVCNVVGVAFTCLNHVSTFSSDRHSPVAINGPGHYANTNYSDLSILIFVDVTVDCV